MALATLRSRALNGLDAPPVAVEVHLANGLPSLALVGLPETEVKEARGRVRAALQSSGFEFPQDYITVNLAPADLPKESGRFRSTNCARHSRRLRPSARQRIDHPRIRRRTGALG